MTELRMLEAERDRLHDELRQVQERLSSDLDAMTRLHHLGSLFVREGNVEHVLVEIVDAAIALSGADFGNIQLLDAESSDLKIVAHRGFPDWWLAFWNQVSRGQGVCGTALECGERVIVEDVERSLIFAGTPALEIQRKAGVRAVQSTPLASRSGKPLGMFSTHWRRPGRPDERCLRLLDLLARHAADIVERAQVEGALRQSEERFRSVFKSAAVGVGRIALDGRFLEVNEAYARIVGYTQEELLDRRFQDITYPEDLETDLNLLAALLEGRHRAYHMEKRYVRKDGELVWVSLSVGLSRDGSGRPAYCSVVVEDITSRKRAEQALRDSEQALRETADRFEMLAHSVPQLVWMADETGAIFWFNQRCFEYTGLTLEELRGWEWQKVVHPDHAARVVRTLLEHVERGEARHDLFPVRRWSGEYRWFLTRTIPIRDERGRVVRWLGTGTDVTEQREGERRKDEFLAMLSHELRNPLAPIRNCTMILRRADPASDQARRARAVIERQSAHLGRLVDDLLDVTRIARGKIELRLLRVDLRDVAMRAADDLQTFMQERGLELRVDVPPAPVWADADATRVTQVIGNLLHNAAKFTSRGGTIELALRRVDDHAEISVRDTGAGIDGALLPRLFDAFVQGERTLARSEGGLGLGLALVKGIAELHGGSVRAESAGIGEGATFVVRLPLAKEAGASQAREPRGRDGRVASSHVLVVDDNRDGADSLAELLTFLGHHVDVAYDGPSALEKIRTNPPNVVLCDLGLPGMSGYDVARTLRAEGSQLRLIAMSGYARPEDILATKEAGFNAHLAKPCDVEEVERLFVS